MSDELKSIPTDVLIRELQNREAIPERCPTCGKWPMRYIRYTGYTKQWHCAGCLKLVEKCTCRG